MTRAQDDCSHSIFYNGLAHGKVEVTWHCEEEATIADRSRTAAAESVETSRRGAAQPASTL